MPRREAFEVPSDREPTNDLSRAIYSQRAIRYWEPKAVPRELLERVVEAAAKAPSGSNLQPWVFVVIDEREPLTHIASALRGFAERTAPLRATLERADLVPDKSQRLMLQGARAFFSQLERAPALIVPCLYRLASPVADPTTLLAGSSIYLAVQNLLLAARGLGLGILMTTAHAGIEAELRSVLALPSDAHPVALIPIGWPAVSFGPTNRKPVGEILRWNRWD
jgi:nitroreductase